MVRAVVVGEGLPEINCKQRNQATAKITAWQRVWRTDTIPCSFPLPSDLLLVSWLEPFRSQRSRETGDVVHRIKYLGAQSTVSKDRQKLEMDRVNRVSTQTPFQMSWAISPIIATFGF